MNLFNPIWNHQTRDEYRVIPSNELCNPSADAVRPRSWLWSSRKSLSVVALCLASFVAGRASPHLYDASVITLEGNETINRGSWKPTGSIIKRFEFNEIYSKSPSKKSNGAWALDIPRGKGFMIEHSEISNISEFSVFHQLHCIDTIRHGYYAALSGKNMSQIMKKNARHLTHCFDFLRQCVQCTADTNLEPVDWDRGGVTGWGFNRVCRDFEAVKRHAEKWKVPGIE